MRVLVMARSSRSCGSDYPVCVGPCTLSRERRAVLGMVRTASRERRAGASTRRPRWLGGGHRGRWARVLLECGDGPDVVDCPATPHSTDGASAFAERDAAAAVRQCAATALPELSLDELFARAYAPQQAHEPPPLAPLPDRRTLLYIRTREKQAELNALASTRGVSSFDSSKIEAVLMGGPRNGLAPSSQLPPAERFSASKRWELSAQRNVHDRLKSSAFRSKLEASLLRRVSAAGSTEDEDESTSERSSSGAGSVATSPLGLSRPVLVRALRPSTSVVSMARVAFEGSCALR